MPKPRSQQISLSSTPYYHCISRCVRRAFLCGQDSLNDKSYEHRRGWVEDKLLALAKVFAIDVCAFSVMSNHTHLVLYVDENTAKSWSIEEVIHQWHQLFNGTLFTQKYINGDKLSKEIINCVIETAEIYRQRLMDISWFMRILNESIARQANDEDKCTGRFWEGRYKSQPLLDEAALVACLAYVDLNPVRAKMA
ncbi:MAG: transposase, partial [Alteromonadaceae bacterium]|nr:transposase [Alteromonadaceae bacterium]